MAFQTQALHYHGLKSSQAQHNVSPQLESQAPYNNPTTYTSSIPIRSLGLAPAPVDCPICRQRTVTNVNHKAGTTTQ